MKEQTAVTMLLVCFGVAAFSVGFLTNDFYHDIKDKIKRKKLSKAVDEYINKHKPESVKEF